MGRVRVSQEPNKCRVRGMTASSFSQWGARRLEVVSAAGEQELLQPIDFHGGLDL